MARIANDKPTLVRNLLAEVENRIHIVNNKLREEQRDEAKLDATYKAGLDASAKTDIKEAFQLLHWLGIVHFSFAVPPALTDGDVDVINLDIRTHDDGE